MVESLKKLSADFSTWDARGVSEWLLSIGRGDLVKAFQDAGITGLSLVLLTEEDLEQHLGVDKTGVRMKLVTELNNLRDSQPTALDRLSTYVFASQCSSQSFPRRRKACGSKCQTGTFFSLSISTN